MKKSMQFLKNFIPLKKLHGFYCLVILYIFDSSSHRNDNLTYQIRSFLCHIFKKLLSIKQNINN